MKLADLRKLSIKKQLRIHFRLQNGMECVISEHGIAHIPELRAAPEVNLERELGSAGEFLLEPAAAPDKKNPARARKLDRAELAAMTTAASASAAHDEHEDEFKHAD